LPVPGYLCKNQNVKKGIHQLLTPKNKVIYKNILSHPEYYKANRTQVTTEILLANEEEIMVTPRVPWDT
jgi:hypothetical protein